MVAGTVRPQSGVRAATARRMSASKQEVPHFYVQTEVELDALEAAVQRARLEEPRMRVTMTAGLAQACGRALRDCPRVNSVWTDEGLLEADEVNLGVAMALGDGLIVPVLLAADRLGLRQLAAALEDLRLRAETRKLRAPEISEGTFTLSNLGMTSVTAFAAIVPQPQVAILATGRSVERCVISGGAPRQAKMMTVTLSADHRALDGMEAGRFLDAFKRAVERPGGDRTEAVNGD